MEQATVVVRSKFIMSSPRLGAGIGHCAGKILGASVIVGFFLTIGQASAGTPNTAQPFSTQREGQCCLLREDPFTDFPQDR
jgi:hypothetical protein